jgi:hypothetical protein
VINRSASACNASASVTWQGQRELWESLVI